MPRGRHHLRLFVRCARAKEWGKILFVPKKPDEKVKASEKARQTADPDKTRDVTLPDQVEEAKHESAKQPARGDRKTDAKWWDPFKILKQGEKLIYPPRTDGNRPH